jgi:peptidoglycan/xylan/chitin deacetylase (PgdA/CDA1 family)
MRKSCNALFGILVLTLASGVTTPVPTEAAELYVRSAYKVMPARLLSYPYGGTYLRVDYARRRLGYPYTGFYYGNYYAPDYAYSYAPPTGITTIPSTRVTTATAAIATALAAVHALSKSILRYGDLGVVLRS